MLKHYTSTINQKELSVITRLNIQYTMVSMLKKNSITYACIVITYLLCTYYAPALVPLHYNFHIIVK